MGSRGVYDTHVSFCLHSCQHLKIYQELPYVTPDTVFWVYEGFLKCQW